MKTFNQFLENTGIFSQEELNKVKNEFDALFASIGIIYHDIAFRSPEHEFNKLLRQIHADLHEAYKKLQVLMIRNTTNRLN